MQVSEAILGRHSCRAFSPSPVDRDTLTRLMELTCRAPSAINLQPWQYTVVMGEEVSRLGRRLMRAHAERGVGCKPDNVSPLPEVYLERQGQLNRGMTPLMKEDGLGREFINHGSLNFYGAPAVVVATLHRVFPEGRALDVGIAVGWLLLAARELGLDTCPVGLVCAYQDVIKDALNIDDDRQVVLAVAVGHAAEGSAVNAFASPRADMSEVVRWY